MNTEFLNKYLKKRFSIPGESTFSKTFKSFSLSERIVFYSLLTVLGILTLGFLFYINNQFLVQIPAKGGSLTEGAVGSPRFINPVLDISDADRDLTALIYSGLMRPGPDGELIPDLAESYSISEDTLTYTFTIRQDAVFSDGSPVTSDDVEFTIFKAQDPALKSPRRANWEGVAINKDGEKEISFTLKQPYSPFLENTTIGILPKHIWKDASSDDIPFSPYNTNPIGSGPYKVSKIGRNSAGTPNEYQLVSFKKYTLGEPYISNLTLKFYPNEEDLIKAYKGRDIEALNSISPGATTELEKSGAPIYKVTLPRIFGVFFNQNQASVLANVEVRVALDTALDKQKIVDSVLLGYGKTLEGPIPFGNLAGDVEATSSEAKIANARNVLERNGWELNPETNIYEKTVKKEKTILSFSIATGDFPELKNSAQSIKEQWEALGAKIDLQIYESGDLQQNIIRPRKYDALYFGEIVGRDLDFYPFWHSSQRNDPGLNISLYVNSEVDKILDDVRSTSDPSQREQDYKDFETEIKKDRPAVFTYSPDFIYVVPNKIKNIKLEKLTMPSERFMNIYQRYIETNKVWKIFAPK